MKRGFKKYSPPSLQGIVLALTMALLFTLNISVAPEDTAGQLLGLQMKEGLLFSASMPDCGVIAVGEKAFGPSAAGFKPFLGQPLDANAFSIPSSMGLISLYPLQGTPGEAPRADLALISGILVALILLLVLVVLGSGRSRPLSYRVSSGLNDELLRVALSHISCMMFEINYHTGRVVSYSAVSNACSSRFIEDSFCENGSFSQIIHPSDPEPVDCAKKCAASGEKSIEYELRLKTCKESDEYIWFKVRVTNVFSGNGSAAFGVGTLENINIRKKREMSLSMMALHDSFTGLLNRTEGARLITDYLLSPCSGGTIIIFDMDNLKEINNAYGHPAGDKAITLISEAVKGVFRSSDIMMRIGGDEFIVFLRNVVDDEFIANRYSLMKQKLLDLYAGSSLPKGIISFSLGYANVFHGDTFDSAYAKADIALYRAKNKGKGTYAAYEENEDIKQISKCGE